MTSQKVYLLLNKSADGKTLTGIPVLLKNPDGTLSAISHIGPSQQINNSSSDQGQEPVNIQNQNVLSKEKSSTTSAINCSGDRQATELTNGNNVSQNKKLSKLAKCPICRDTLANMRNLRKHISSKHPEKISSLQASLKKDSPLYLSLFSPRDVKSYKFKCSVCSNRRFNDVYNLTYHERKVHGVVRQDAQRKIIRKCPLCDLEFDRRELCCEHLTSVHGVSLKDETITFKNYNEFLTWKANEQRETKVIFVKNHTHGGGSASKKTFQYFNCHRSGNFSSRSTGKRRLKTQGSKKMNAYCPAYMKLAHVEGEELVVHYQSVHVGHSDDLSHFQLTPEDRRYLADKLQTGVSLDTILAEVRNSAPEDGRSSRLSILTKKDLYNIRQSFGITVVPAPPTTPQIRPNARGKRKKRLKPQSKTPPPTPVSDNSNFVASVNCDYESEVVIESVLNYDDEMSSDFSTSVAEEKKNLLKQMFAHFVDTATPEEFEFLETTTLSLESELKKIRENGCSDIH